MNDAVSFFGELTRLARQRPDHAALCYRVRSRIEHKTYRQALGQVAACSQVFRNLPQKRVGILGTNTWQWVCNAFGLLAAGKTVALLDPLLPEEDLIHAAEYTDLELLVAEEDSLPLAHTVQSALPGISVMAYHVAPETEQLLELRSEWGGEIIFFTSGTTKHSKAVVTTLDAVAGQAKEQQAVTQYEAGDLVMCPPPLHHAYGFSQLIFWFQVGCPIMISAMKSVLADLRLIAPQRLMLVPSAARFLLDKGAFPQGLKSVITAGSALPEELAEGIRALGIAVQNQYGSSEYSGSIGENLPGDPIDKLTLHESVTAEISPEGEVLVHTPYHFKEYYKDPDGTAATLRQGVIHTADAGVLDGQGRLRLLGRKKNMILMENGEKVFCQDVDRELTALPFIGDAAVIYEDKQLIAVVAPQKGASGEDVLASIARYNKVQPYYRRIKHTWVYGNALPYTSSGKLHRSRLEEEYRSQKSQ